MPSFSFGIGRKALLVMAVWLSGVMLGHQSLHASSGPECNSALRALAMEYVDLTSGNGDVKRVSRLVLGTDHLVQGKWTSETQPEPTEGAAFEVLDEAAKLGINFFDTAPIYVGDVESRIGKWRKSRAGDAAKEEFYHSAKLNPDRKLYLLSKGGFPFDLYWARRLETGSHSAELKAELARQGILKASGPVADGTTPLEPVPAGTYASRLYGSEAQIAERVIEELGHTRKNLNDDITVYLMHRDDGDAVKFKAVGRAQTPVGTILKSLAVKEISGQVGMIGWSNWETERVDESLRLAKQDGSLPMPRINSPYFSLFEMSETTIHALGVQVTHAEMMDPNFQKGIKIMPYSPLGGFSILDQPSPSWEKAKEVARKKFERGDPYWQNVFHSIFTPENEARWNRVVDFTAEFNQRRGTSYTVDQMVNAYVLAHPRTDLLAVGAITVEQVRRTVESLKLSKLLTPEDLNFLYDGRR